MRHDAGGSRTSACGAPTWAATCIRGVATASSRAEVCRGLTWAKCALAGRFCRWAVLWLGRWASPVIQHTACPRAARRDVVCCHAVCALCQHSLCHSGRLARVANWRKGCSDEPSWRPLLRLGDWPWPDRQECALIWAQGGGLAVRSAGHGPGGSSCWCWWVPPANIAGAGACILLWLVSGRSGGRPHLRSSGNAVRVRVRVFDSFRDILRQQFTFTADFIDPTRALLNTGFAAPPVVGQVGRVAW